PCRPAGRRRRTAARVLRAGAASARATERRRGPPRRVPRVHSDARPASGRCPRPARRAAALSRAPMVATMLTGDGRAALRFAHAAGRARGWAARLAGRRPLFVCTIAQTDTARIPGISAAGATPELRELTPAADAEALYYGSARCLHGVPANPLGPP